MLKPNTLSTSSTVSAVFEGFLRKLEVAKIADVVIIDRLRKSLNAQKLDEDSLQEALYGEPENRP